MAKILFSVTKSPYDETVWKTLVKVIKNSLKEGEEIGLLLLQDAVIAAKESTKNPLNGLEDIVVYASKEDLEARGLDKLLSEIKTVSAPDIIDLVGEKYEKVFSWN